MLEKINKKHLLIPIILIVALVAYTLSNNPSKQSTTVATSGEPAIKPTVDDTLTAPTFALRDISGQSKSLTDFKGTPVALHFMAVGCGGQIAPINENQFKELKKLCTLKCGEKKLSIITVAVSTCENSELAKIRDAYGVTWLFGNDYDDKKIDIIESYKNFNLSDGTILLLDKDLTLIQSYIGKVTYQKLQEKLGLG